MSWIVKEGKYFQKINLFDSNLLGIQNQMCFYIIRGNKKVVMIDAPGPLEAETFSEKFNTIGIKPDILILTHSHWDHAAGTAIFQEKFPDIEVMVGKTGVNSLKNNAIFNNNFKNLKDIPDLKSIKDLIPLDDGDTIDLGGTELSIIETPGHTDCSISIFEPKQKILFIGDALGNIWKLDFIIPTIMPPQFSEKKFLASIEKIKNLEYSALAFAHYGIITDSLAEQIPDKAKSSYYNWRNFLVETWNKKNNKEYCAKKFAKKLYSMGFDDTESKISFDMFGGWMIEGLKSGNLI
ncbi:MAG: MBL fold metallo-hydrolase [Candidatus Thorarchaeota archaeon]